MTQDEMRKTLPKGKPGKGWVWSDRLQKWRRPAARKFMVDRQGIHIVLGAVVALPLVLLGVAEKFWLDDVGPIALGWIWAATVVTHLFLRYEEVEAKEISDDAYIDIGGFLGGFLAVALVACAVWAWTLF